MCNVHFMQAVMLKFLSSLLLYSAYLICIEGESSNSYPTGLPATVYSSQNSSGSTCPSQDTINAELEKVIASIQDYHRTLNRTLPVCSCGGPGWTRVAYLDMSDTNQQCPSNWKLTTSPVRGCGRSSSGKKTCDSMIYPVSGRTYSSVCGRINAYQNGFSYGFRNSLQSNFNLDQSYISGVSVTHGPAGNRTHIWSFVGAASESSTTTTLYTCPCTNNALNWSYQIPSSINNEYFCDTINSEESTQLFTENLLWDGEGCSPTSTCCTFNSPPWFCKSLPQPTSDDVEIRLCSHDSREKKLIYQLEIYVK